MPRICELDLRQLGRLGARTLGYTIALSVISVLIGLALGEGMGEEVRALARSAPLVKAAAAPERDGALRGRDEPAREAAPAVRDGAWAPPGGAWDLLAVRQARNGWAR